VVFARVNLTYDATHARLIVSKEYEEILHNEPPFRVIIDDLDVSKALLIGAHLILTLHDKNSTRPKYAKCLDRCIEIQLKHGLVILF
jgi:hypothetical protein